MTDNLKRYIALREQIRELEQRAEALRKEAAQLEEQLLEQFTQAGMQRVSIDGKTIYLHRQHWASVVPERLAELRSALTAHGLEDMLTVNASRLSAWAREYETETGDIVLPPEFANLVNVTERVSLRVVHQ